MKRPKDILGFVDSYKNTLKNLEESSSAAYWWAGNFLMLFFLPVLYPLLWVVMKIKEIMCD